MEILSPLKIAVTGTAGVGKTTLVNALAAHYVIPVIEEDFLGMVKASVDLGKSREPAQTRAGIQSFLEEMARWLTARAAVCTGTESFVMDRCAFDALRIVVMSALPLSNDVLHRLIRSCHEQCRALDLVVVPALVMRNTEEAQNEKGLVRNPNFVNRLRAQSTLIGLLQQFCPAPRLEIPHSCRTTEERIALVAKTIERVRARKQAQSPA